MRLKLFLIAVWLCAVMTGCEIYNLGAHNVLHELGRHRDERLTWARHRALAHEAWEEILRCHAGTAYSPEYENGFVDGFVDYLDAGGTGEPPVLPPSHYWKRFYESPDGHMAIEDWFAGFRHGSGTAKASGLRPLMIVPYTCSSCGPVTGAPIDGGIITHPAEPLPPPVPEAMPPQAGKSDRGASNKK